MTDLWPRNPPVACRDKAHRHVVLMRNCNYSAFSGYRWTPSDYSLVRCTVTHRSWRTKAAYVDALPDAVGDERQVEVEV